MREEEEEEEESSNSTREGMTKIKYEDDQESTPLT